MKQILRVALQFTSECLNFSLLAYGGKFSDSSNMHGLAMPVAASCGFKCCSRPCEEITSTLASGSLMPRLESGLHARHARVKKALSVDLLERPSESFDGLIEYSWLSQEHQT